MTDEQLAAERERFNALTPEDAKALLAAAEGQRPDFRSCWYCNGAHDHLKNREVMLCFSCGFYYLGGFPAQAVARRAADVLVTDDEMKQFNDALDD